MQRINCMAGEAKYDAVASIMDRVSTVGSAAGGYSWGRMVGAGEGGRDLSGMQFPPPFSTFTAN